MRTQLAHFTDTNIASEGVKTDRRSDACSAQACTSFRDCTCLTRVGVVVSLRAMHSDCFQSTITDCSHRTTAVHSTMLQNTHTVQLPYGISQRRPSPFCMAAYTRDSYSNVGLRGFLQSHPSAGTVPHTGTPRPSIRSLPHSTPHSVAYSTVLLKGENT